MDGICDDGGVDSVNEHCDLGSDCFDCRPDIMPSPSPPSTRELAKAALKDFIKTRLERKIVAELCAQPCGTATCADYQTSKTCAQLSLLACDCSGCCSEELPSF